MKTISSLTTLETFFCFFDQVKTEISGLFSLIFSFCSSHEASVLVLFSPEVQLLKY